MDLLCQIGLSDRTGKDVQSYKDKGSMVVFAIFADIHALHKPHVSLKRQWTSKPGTCPGPADVPM